MKSVTQGAVRLKVGLLNLAAELGQVTRACKMMGFAYSDNRDHRFR